MSNNINDALSLGKGEVDSSILSGSTSKPTFIGPFGEHVFVQSATRDGTMREPRRSIRGKSVDSVPPSFTGDDQ